MRPLTQTIEEQLLRVLGAEKRRPLGLGTWGAALPLVTGMLVGGALGLVLAPKAGHLLRKDIAQWMKSVNEQGLRESAKEMLRKAPMQPVAEPIETGGRSAHNGS